MTAVRQSHPAFVVSPSSRTEQTPTRGIDRYGPWCDDGKMEINTQAMEGSKKPASNDGLTSLIAGIMQIIFSGIGLSLLGIVGMMVFLANIISASKAFRQDDKRQRTLAIIGMTLSVVMIALWFLSGFDISGSIFNYFWLKAGNTIPS